MNVRTLIATLGLVTALAVTPPSRLSAQMQHQHHAATEDGQFNPFVIADGKDGFFISYVQRTANKSDVMLVRTSDGKTMSKPVRVNDVAGDATVRNENPPKLALGKNGEVFAVWANERERWKGNIRFARSTNGGQTFLPSISLNSDAAGGPIGHAFQSMVVDKQGRVHVAWIDERNKKAADRGGEIWMTTSEDGGKTFQQNRRIIGDICECCRTSLLVDTEGRMYMSYRTVPPTGPMFRDVVVIRSDDGGKTFAKTVVSQDRWEIQACPVAGPSMALDGTGKLLVTWFTQSDGKPQMYSAMSSDRGVTFGGRKSIDPTQVLAKHSHMASVPGGGVAVAWDDINGEPLVHWGLMDMATGSVRKRGTDKGASYPVVAVSGQKVAIVASLGSSRTLLQRVEPLARQATMNQP